MADCSIDLGKSANNAKDAFVARAALLALEPTGWALHDALELIRKLPASDDAMIMAERAIVVDKLETEAKRLDFLFGISRK